MNRKLLNILIVLAVMPMLQGCFLVAGLAALGGGGYYIGTKAGKREDERIKTQALIDVKRDLEDKQTQEQAQDKGIANQINQNYLAGSLTSNIAVYPEVRNGVVILHGRVPDAATAERAIAAARKTQGVERIISNLVIVNQPGGMPVQAQQPVPAAVPQQYQQQYQNFMQQYQQQPNMQPMMVPAPAAVPQAPSNQPVRAYYQQSDGSLVPANKYTPPIGSSNTNKQQVAVAHKVQKKQNHAPPQKQANIPKNEKPKLLSEQQLEYYEDDNDSKYRIYKPKRISKNTTPAAPAQAAQQKDVIFVPVPVPSYEYDNDSMYRNVGSFNPRPIGSATPSSFDAGIAAPSAAAAQDNEIELDFYY